MSNPHIETAKKRKMTKGEETDLSRSRLSSSSEPSVRETENTSEMEIQTRGMSLKKTITQTLSVLSLASNKSMYTPPEFHLEPKGSSESTENTSEMEIQTRGMSLKKTITQTLSVLSLASNKSMYTPPEFHLEPKGSSCSTSKMETETRGKSLKKTITQTPSVLSLASNKSMYTPLEFHLEPKGVQKTVVSTVLSEISLVSDPSVVKKSSKRRLCLECCVCEETCGDDPEYTESSVHFTCGHVACAHCVAKWTYSVTEQYHCPMCGSNMRRTLSQTLQFNKPNGELSNIIQNFKKQMHNKFSIVNEGNGDERSPLKHIYTSLSVSFRRRDDPQQHYFKTLSDLQQQDSPNSDIDIGEVLAHFSTKFTRTFLTNGMAGIGKSFSVQKLIVDWAEGTSYQDVHFIFCLSFRELNLIKEDTSFLQLLKVFHPAVSDLKPQDLDQTKVIVVLDGFDESRFHLNFNDPKRVSSVEEPASVSSLMINLIQGNLLPNAQLWITSRPAASYQIPEELIHRVSEIQGFNDQQKEEYFKKRFRNKSDVAKAVISFIQSSPTLDLLCQIPIFCWMLSVLLEEVFGGEEQKEAPQTLTEMMGAFLFIQTKRSSRKYDQNPERDRTKLLKAKRGFLLKLGKLAFIHLLENNLIFYEEDLQECGLDPKQATINSGFFNTVFREEQLFLQQKVFYFVHLTIQEFFAALYVYDCFTNNKLWATELSSFLGLDHSESTRPPMFDLLKMTVDKVLEKNSGHLNFFLRFLLGLVVESNQRYICGLLLPQESSPETVKKMLLHLKAIRRKTVSPDACINLFQSMVEMGDNKISEDIDEYLKSEDRARITLTPLHCSALAFTIQVSKSVLEELTLKSYNTSEEGRRRLIPAVRSSRRANLSECRVSEDFLKPLSLALSLPHSSLRDLDLTNTDLGDSGVEQLCEGLESPVCKLRILSLSGCLVTDRGCDFLVSALKLNPSHLMELDLSYNHLEASGKAALNDLNLSRLQINFSHNGSQRMIPGLKKYWCALSWDTKLAHSSVQVSEEQRKVSRSEDGPDHELVLGEQELSGRCYWEIEASGSLNIGVMYKRRESEQTDLRLGQNEKSWSFVCSEEGCYAFHNNKSTAVKVPHFRSSRLAVYLDRPAGVLSFYKVSAESRVLLHTFTGKFTKGLFPAAELKPKSSAKFYPKHEERKT